MDDLSKIMITAAGTLVVGLIVGLFTWNVQSKREHAKWVRERRFEIYSEISALGSSIFARTRVEGNEDLEGTLLKYERMHALMARLNFVGPRAMWALGAAMLTSADSIRESESDADRIETLERFTEISQRFANEAAKTLKF